MNDNNNNNNNERRSFSSDEYGLFVPVELNKQIRDSLRSTHDDSDDSDETDDEIDVLITVRVGGLDLSDEGYSFRMTATQSFEALYRLYTECQQNPASAYDLWHGGVKLSYDSTPALFGLLDGARVTATGKNTTMNMDSLLVVVTLLGTLNNPDEFLARLTLRKEERMTDVCERVASIIGLRPGSSLLLGVRGKRIDSRLLVRDTIIKNEDKLWWMEDGVGVIFHW